MEDLGVNKKRERQEKRVSGAGDGTVLYDREWDLKFGVGPVLHDGDDENITTTGCDDATVKILDVLMALALKVHNNTHLIKFRSVSLVCANGYLAVGSTVDLVFKAEADTLPPVTQTLRARVSSTRSRNYVEFVEFHPDDPFLITPSS